MSTLTGRVAIVTGAGAGLGLAEARALAAAGAQVIVNDMGDAAEKAAATITADGGTAHAVPGDISDWDVATSLITTAVEKFGDLHILVNNAGVVRDRMIFSVSAQEWDTVIGVHLRGHAATSRAATGYWRDRSKDAGGPVYARIINTASEAFLFGAAGQPNYAAAKAGIVALTLATAQGCARYGVRANAIAPRARTAMTAEVFPDAPTDGPDPLGVDHVAPVVTWLASPGADHINGQVFIVYGGKIGVMRAPTLDATFTTSAASFSTAELDATVGAYLADGAPHGFAVGTDLRL